MERNISMENLIEIKDMHKIYNPGENEVRALDGVDLSIADREFVAIIGQSGSGKSTLMNMLGCLDVPTSGSYYLHGQDVSQMLDDELSDIRNKEIGFIFQGFNLISNLTALENVELPLIYRGVGKKERTELAKVALEKVGLGNRMSHKPTEMSGGQQQRVAIARAIAQAPPIILADEPTGNLDSRSSEEIMGILKDLHEEGRTVILITHDNGIAARAKRVIRISDGRIIDDYMNDAETMAHADTNKNIAGSEMPKEAAVSEVEATKAEAVAESSKEAEAATVENDNQAATENNETHIMLANYDDEPAGDKEE